VGRAPALTEGSPTRQLPRRNLREFGERDTAARRRASTFRNLTWHKLDGKPGVGWGLLDRISAAASARLPRSDRRGRRPSSL